MPKIRLGKTGKEHRNGAHGRRIAHRQARAEWSNNPARTQANFPYKVCNGQRNRTRWTGKGNQTIIRSFTIKPGW